MDYAAPVNFDSIEAALDFVKHELQAKVDKNNAMALEGEKNNQKLRILQEQVDDLNAKSQNLVQNIAKLEGKREAVKQELRDHADTVTARLEKERADFESVRIKRRTELEEREKSLDTRQAELDQISLQLSGRESSLDERQRSLVGVEDGLIVRENELSKREKATEDDIAGHISQMELDKASIQKDAEDIAERRLLITSQQGALDRNSLIAQEDVKNAEKYKDDALTFMAMAENKLKSVEKVAISQKERDNQLNLRQASLVELEKSLTKRKIQLDDREATIKSHGGI